uniref:non-specific serine/threonine protein kinase n=1 Tax=Theileria annulata TaxID=5874 RepID=A0A3B0MYD1_THEAN
MMKPLYYNIEKSANSKKLPNEFNTLTNHKTKLLNLINDEIKYANFELNIINYLFSLNSSLGDDGSESDDLSDLNDKFHLLKFGTHDFFETKYNLKNELEESLKMIDKSLRKRNDYNKYSSDFKQVKESMTNLQTTYFNSLQQRESNMKLLLRLKMFTCNRLNNLNESLKAYESLTSNQSLKGYEPMKNFKPKYNENSTKLVSHMDKNNPNHISKHNLNVDHTNDTEYKQFIKECVNYDFSTKLNISNTHKFDSSLTILPEFRSPYSSNLLNIFSWTISLDRFKESAKTLFTKYGKSYMPLNVFNNLVLHLIQSLHLRSLCKIPIEHIYEVYNVNSNTMLDFRTFSLLYWEILHALRRSIELYYQPQYRIPDSLMYLNDYDHFHQFVNISDYYSFIKRLSPGRSCNKYVAKELETNELRVVEIYCKTPDFPPFHEIYSEIDNLKNLQHKNLVKYLAVYHDYNTVYVVTEFCSELSLLNKLNSLETSDFVYSLSFVHNVFTQIVEALVYLHCNNLVHKCLAIDKVMIDDSSSLPIIKIGDYGLTESLDKYKHKSLLSSLHKAPEVIRDNVNQKSNVWSAGIILLFLTTGELPLNNVKQEVFLDNLSEYLKNSKMFKIDCDLMDLINYMLTYDHNLRPSSYDVLTHHWFNCTNISNTRVNTSYLSRNLRALMEINSYRKICRLVENSNIFHINKLNKFMNTLLLSTDPGDNNLLSYGNFVKALKMQNVQNNIISELVHLTSVNGSDKCRLNDLFDAFKSWRFGEINIFWSICKKYIDENDWSFDFKQFREVLQESKTSLLMNEEINGFCRSIAIDGKVTYDL